MQIVEPTRKFVFRKIVDDCILVPTAPDVRAKDRLLVLNPVGAAIYSGINGGKQGEQILSELKVDFQDISESQLELDMQEFIQQLIDMEVLRVASPPN